MPADPAISEDAMMEGDDVVDSVFQSDLMDLESPVPSGASGSRRKSIRSILDELDDLPEDEDVDNT